MLTAEINAKVFVKPKIIFTLKGQSRSERVIESLKKSPHLNGCELRVFESPAFIEVCFTSGEHSADEAVVIFDGSPGNNHFRPVAYGRDGHTIPSWARGTKWGVVCGSALDDGNSMWNRAENCAQQIAADFLHYFEERIDTGKFPWGSGRRGESPPSRVELPADIQTVVERLNSGPDLLASVSSDELRRQLPPNSKISWKRIPARPARYSLDRMQGYLKAVSAFERACAKLARENGRVRDALLAGVILDENEPRLIDCYLNPHWGEKPVSEWSVRRPDMHVNGSQLAASENDEMPGGFTDLVHIDHAYGINGGKWQRAWEFLFERGPLLFVVSDGWSVGYIESTRWLVGHLRERGLPAHLVTSNRMNGVDINDDGVFIGGERVGTVWRQFPIFETKGKLAQLVYAAQAGKVRMVPEFAHFGNKTWFSLYRMHHDWFANELGEENTRILDQLLPDSHLVRYDEQNFPCSVGGVTISSFAELRDEKRARLVLKVTGANDHAARSYGVFIGYARPQKDWQDWLDSRKARQQPFIIQEVFETSVEKIAVLNTVTGAAEIFRCKVLLRPWVVNGELVSSHNCCTPHYTTKVHGMVDMAVQPVEYA